MVCHASELCYDGWGADLERVEFGEDVAAEDGLDIMHVVVPAKIALVV